MFRTLFAIRTANIRFQECRRQVRDVGIRRRKAALNLNQEEVEEIEEFESDFMEVHKSHKEHLKELDVRKEKLKYDIVHEKYFKEKYPNFLTWHDKEQIRYLHRTDPEHWTIEQLSESFPALPEIIRKLVKSNWTKTKQIKIDNHDDSVKRNWEIFKKGKFTQDLPNDLVQHLKKFTNRALIFQPFIMPDMQNKVTIRNTKCNEFSEIITSYQNLKKQDQESIQQSSEKISNKSIEKPPTTDTYLYSKIKNKEQITLSKLKENLKNRENEGQIDLQDKLILQSLEDKEEDKDAIQTFETVDLNIKKYEGASSKLSNVVKKDNNLQHLSYPEKIVIPKELIKKNNIYKLNDCYYDYDGIFLYRVPGMG